MIEFDGIHHRIPIEIWGGLPYFIKIQKIDKLKTEYCKNNNIKLIRIDDFNLIETVLIQEGIILS